VLFTKTKLIAKLNALSLTIGDSADTDCCAVLFTDHSPVEAVVPDVLHVLCHVYIYIYIHTYI
jgi:hypothetical protein